MATPKADIEAKIAWRKQHESLKPAETKEETVADFIQKQGVVNIVGDRLYFHCNGLDQLLGKCKANQLRKQ